MADDNSLGTMKDIIASRRARIGIFGAGYVGLPLACAFAQAAAFSNTRRDKGKASALWSGTN